MNLNEHTQFEERSVVEYAQGRTGSQRLTNRQRTLTARYGDIFDHARYILHQQVEVLVVHLVLEVSAYRHVITVHHRKTQFDTGRTDET